MKFDKESTRVRLRGETEMSRDRENNKTAILVAIIGAVSTILAAFIGVQFEKSQQSKIIDSQLAIINGDNNTVTINSVSELVEEYNKLLEENESLTEQNKSYFDELKIKKEELSSLQQQMENTPILGYKSLSLCVDGTDIPINSTNSFVSIDGRDYVSKEMLEKLIDDTTNITIKNDSLYIGKVIADKTNLFKQYVMEKSNCVLDHTIKDSYGKSYSNAMVFKQSKGFTVFSLDRKYSILKFTVAVSEYVSLGETATLTITPDTGDPHTIELEKTTEAYEVEIPINNCSLLTFECVSDYSDYTVIISDAIVFN